MAIFAADVLRMDCTKRESEIETHIRRTHLCGRELPDFHTFRDN